MKYAKIHCAFFFFFFFAFPAAAVFCILPILQSQPRHPYSSWYPFEVVNTGTNIKLYTTVVYETICMLTTALLNVSTDVFLYSLIVMVYYQIQLLELRLTQIGWNESEFVGHSAYGRRDYFKRIVECISLHQEIKRLLCVSSFLIRCNHFQYFRFVTDYHLLFNSIIFVQIVQSIIVFSMTTLQLIIVSMMYDHKHTKSNGTTYTNILYFQIPFGSASFILNFLHLNVMASEVYEYCRFGNRLIYSVRNN